MEKEGKTIGLVPTMGFLHEGHASLIKNAESRMTLEEVTLSIQHSLVRQRILRHIQRDFRRDSKLCESLGADLIFCPEPSEMYHDPHAFVSIEYII